MDRDFSARVSRELGIPGDIIQQYNLLFDDRIKPKIKTKFLSHLVTTIEDLINEKKLKGVLEIIKGKKHDPQEIKSLYNNRNIRFYSIVLIPINLKRRATTRYHNFGASVFYNSCYEDKQIRLLIAHELGHIINME
ncbi:MAG: hypothetical protein LBK02_04145 [Treponema sp.]|jgi:hypothetical protein|nr:hypothetical protein [Treponema sp.]